MKKNRLYTKFIDFSIKLDEGNINESFAEKYKFYFDQFLEINSPNEKADLNTALQELLRNIDIRSQEKIIEKANMVHSIICNQKVDISVMLFEIMYEAFCLQGIHNMDCIAVIEESVPENVKENLAQRKIEFLKSMEKVSWHGKVTSAIVSSTREKKRIAFNLYGKVFWYFAKIFNKENNPYIEYGTHNKEIENQLEIAKNYCDFCKIIK